MRVLAPVISWLQVSAVVLGSLLLVLLADRLGRTPGEKQVHLFEDERGNRTNPFGDLSEGASDSRGTCRTCGRSLSGDAYRFCSSCVESSHTDD